MRTSLYQLLERPACIPSIPKVVQQLLLTFNQPEVELAEIAALISKDEGIAIKVLRLVNSSSFAGARKVEDLDQACIRLGLDVIRTLVLACGLTASVASVPHLDLKAFWTRSFDVADMAGSIAGLVGLKKELLKTIGMLHNIGEIVVHNALPDQALQVLLLMKQGRSRLQAEIEVLGFTSAEVSGRVLDRWQLPVSIFLPIEQQHKPKSREAAVLYLASWLEKRLSQEFELAPPADFPPSLARALELEWPQVLTVHQILREHGNEFAALLN